MAGEREAIDGGARCALRATSGDGDCPEYRGRGKGRQAPSAREKGVARPVSGR
jgi:hypothetical protein